MTYRLAISGILFSFLTFLPAVEKDPWGKPIEVLPWMGQDWPMRMRVCADYTSGIAWRLPYALLPQDQDQARYSRIRNKTVYIPSGKSITGQPAVTKTTQLEWDATPVAELISEIVTIPAPDLSTTGNRLAGAKLNWKPIDYYSEIERRPFADPKYAPAGITALIGEGNGIRVLMLAHGERQSAAIVRGKMITQDALFRNVQVMASSKDGKTLHTWAEAKGALGFALDKDANPVNRVSVTPPNWANGYDLETRHFHISGNSSPARLATHGANLEALYTNYAAFFDIKDTSPLKFEVHITNTWKEFANLSASCDYPLEVAKGSVLGGFFIPRYQSLWLYEESEKLGGPSLSIEHVMCHECSHQFLHMACNGTDHVPTWINEGIAVHFENGVLANGKYIHHPPVDRIKRLASLYQIRKTTLQPLNVYLDHHGAIGADLYGEVYAMVHFWAFGTPEGRVLFQEYWKALRAGENGLVAFERIFTAPLAKAAGGRQAGLDRWRDRLTTYVQRELTKLR